MTPFSDAGASEEMTVRLSEADADHLLAMAEWALNHPDLNMGHGLAWDGAVVATRKIESVADLWRQGVRTERAEGERCSDCDGTGTRRVHGAQDYGVSFESETCDRCALGQAMLHAEALEEELAELRAEGGMVRLTDMLAFLRKQAECASPRLDSSPRFTLLELVGKVEVEFGEARDGE